MSDPPGPVDVVPAPRPVPHTPTPPPVTAVPPPGRAGLRGDVLGSMVAAGVPPVLIVACWGSALLLSGTYLTDLLVKAGIAHPTAVALSVLAAVVLALAVWARMMYPDVTRRMVTLTAGSVGGLWVAAGVASDASAALVVLVPAWSMVGTAAGVRLVVDRQRRTTHALYRYFDRAGRLLYVGRTRQGQGRRARQHAGDKWWWPQVASREVTYLPTHSALAAAEREAIIRERPIHNKVHNPRWTRRGRR